MPKLPSYSSRKHKATPETVCQKCLGRGHYNFECKNERAYVSRPSPSQLLEEKYKGSAEIPHAGFSMFRSKLEIENKDSRKFMEEKEQQKKQKKEEKRQRKKEKKEKKEIQRRETQFPSIYSIPFTISGLKGSPFKFCSGYLFESPNILKILDNVRQHLLKSSLAQSIYVEMATMFYESLSLDTADPKNHLSFNPPTDLDFKHYILQKWPSLVWFGPSPPKKPLKWGSVSKEVGTPNQIKILSSIVMEAESSSRNMNIPYNLIITIIILHELSHAFTKDYFDRIITPLSVGSNPKGESGFLVEDKIVGGRLSVEWDNPEDFKDMGKISRVVIEKDYRHSLTVDVNTANDFLSSFKPFKLSVRKDRKRQQMPSSTLRANVTEETTNPLWNKPESARIGLGITFEDDFKGVRSFVGDDKGLEFSFH